MAAHAARMRAAAHHADKQHNDHFAVHRALDQRPQPFHAFVVGDQMASGDEGRARVHQENKGEHNGELQNRPWRILGQLPWPFQKVSSQPHQNSCDTHRSHGVKVVDREQERDSQGWASPENNAEITDQDWPDGNFEPDGDDDEVMTDKNLCESGKNFRRRRRLLTRNDPDVGDWSQSAHQASANPPRDNSNQETQQIASVERFAKQWRSKLSYIDASTTARCC